MKKPLVLLVFVVLVLGAGVIFFLIERRTVNSRTNTSSSQVKNAAPAKPLTLTAREVGGLEITNEKSEVTLSTFGGVLSATFPDGTVAYLVFPPDSLAVPTAITFAPLTELPVEGFAKTKKSYAVSFGPEDGAGFIQTRAYLVFDMRPDKSLPLGKAARISPCRFEFIYFNPILCAAENNVPLDFGVTKGEVVFGYEFRNQQMSQLYTLNTGLKDVVVARLNDTGAFFYTSLTEDLSAQVAATTLAHTDEVNQSLTATAHLAQMGRIDQSTRQNFTKNIARGEGLEPYEALQAALIAAALGEKSAGNEMLANYEHRFDVILDGIRAFGEQWPEFPASARLFTLSTNKKQFAAAKTLTPAPRPDDPRILTRIEEVLNDEELNDEWMFALAADNQIAKRITRASTVPIAYAVKDPEAREARLGVQISEAGERCDYADLYWWITVFIDPRWGGMGERLTELASKYVHDCLNKDLEEAETFDDAADVGGTALIFEETEIAQRAFSVAKLLPKAFCGTDLTHKTLANFGKNDCGN